jgi:hypothetical protein
MGMPLIIRSPVPVLVKVTDCEALVVEINREANVKLVGEKLTAGASPVPLRLTVCGLLVAKSVRVSAPETGPEVEGRKLTLTIQLELAAMDGRQLSVSVQPLETARLVMAMAAELLFVIVTGWEALEVPTSWLLKVNPPGETVGADTMPAPVSAMD